jgi:hypothetical protein
MKTGIYKQKQTLKQKLGTGIVWGAIGLGSLTGLIGCTEEEAKMGSLFGTVGMMNPNATPSDAAFAAGMRDYSQNSLNSINAEKSRAQVNVQVYNGNTSQGDTKEKYEDLIVYINGYKKKCHITGEMKEGTQEYLLFMEEGGDNLRRSPKDKIEYWCYNCI